MADLATFAEKDFDAKQFINNICLQKPSEQALDRYLAELEMKLHLGAEDIGLYLQDQATRATQRIPVAARELARIREDAQSVRSAVAITLSNLQDDASDGSAAQALAAIEELDRVKARMEAACITLKEAAGLSALFHLVDDLFAAGDLPRIADALAGMRRGLAVVADSVPEFRNGRQRLAALEDRFAAAVEGPLATALSGQRGDEAASLSAMLSSLGRSEMVARAYVSARSPPLHSLWDGYTQSTPFVPWLSTFYDQILHSVASECEWCRTSLPDQYPKVVLGMLSTFFAAIDKPHRARLAGALTGVAGSLLPLEHLEQAAAAAADFIEGLRSELSSAGAVEGAGGSALSSLLPLVLAPVEGAVAQYPDKELQYLTAELSSLISAARESVSPGVSLSMALRDTVDPAFNAASAAVARCVKLTGGTALPALARTLDRALQQYLGAIKAAIQRPSGGGAAASSANNKGAPQQIPLSPEASLPLLLVVSKLQQRLEQCAVTTQNAFSEIIPPLVSNAAVQSEGKTVPPFSLAAIRITAQPAIRQQLSAYLDTDTPHALLPNSNNALNELAASVESLVESTLCARLRTHFAPLPSLPEWQAQPTSAVALPSFTPYPLQYVTAAGEHLMMMPQLLESTLTAEQQQHGEEPRDDSGDGAVAAQLVADWVDRVALVAARQYQEQLQQIQRLSEQGAAQLAADIEYFCNVLNTLGLGAPSALAAWQAALMASDAAALQAVAGLVVGENDNSEARGAVELVAKLRKLDLSPTSA